MGSYCSVSSSSSGSRPGRHTCAARVMHCNDLCMWAHRCLASGGGWLCVWHLCMRHAALCGLVLCACCALPVQVEQLSSWLL